MSHLIRGSCEFCGHGCSREYRPDLKEKYPGDRNLITLEIPGFYGKPVCDVCWGKIKDKLQTLFKSWTEE